MAGRPPPLSCSIAMEGNSSLPGSQCSQPVHPVNPLSGCFRDTHPFHPGRRLPDGFHHRSPASLLAVWTFAQRSSPSCASTADHQTRCCQIALSPTYWSDSYPISQPVLDLWVTLRARSWGEISDRFRYKHKQASQTRLLVRKRFKLSLGMHKLFFIIPEKVDFGCKRLIRVCAVAGGMVHVFQ